MASVDRTVQGVLGDITAWYHSETGESLQVEGMFDEQYRLSDRGEAGVESMVPAFFCRLSDLPLDPDEDDPELEVGGKFYHVRERQRDGMGGVRLLLLRADEQ